MFKHYLKTLVVTAVLFIGIGNHCEAAVIPAASPAFQDVSAAVAQASPGDTVTVPAGTAVWTNALSIYKDIQLVGAGIGQTILIDEEIRIPWSFAFLMAWHPVPSGSVRLSGFTFQGGIPKSSPQSGAIYFGGFCSDVRIDHCRLENLHNEGIWIEGAVFGVIDHCEFYQTNWENAVTVENGGIGGDPGNGGFGYGDKSWATPVLWGQTNDFVYIEDCSFYNPAGPAVDDFAKGSRVVFRYNSCTNTYFQNHGTESSQRNRGGRAFEVYGNTFVVNNGMGQPNTPMFFRSGSGVIFSNSFSGYSQFWSLANFRSVDAFDPWGSANGQNPWDSNNPTMFYSGTHTDSQATGHLTASNATWTVNQWVGGYELQNTSLGGTNRGSYSLIYSNDAHNIYYLASVYLGYMKFTSGQTYAIYKTYAQLDQIGRGQGDLVGDSSPGNGVPINTVTGQPGWPNEASDPIYQWHNTYNGIENYQYGPSVAAYDIVLNRDYFDNTPKPGYVPLVYPHPLVSGVGLTGGGSGNGQPTNTVPNNLLSPPSGLSVFKP